MVGNHIATKPRAVVPSYANHCIGKVSAILQRGKLHPEIYGIWPRKGKSSLLLNSDGGKGAVEAVDSFPGPNPITVWIEEIVVVIR
ncbi:hypothetical protein DO97_07960 [Neosynechococcus sphagnicola sy1]|uniref:Uncharacterized protein n=1 Tax=Neosynechococcus sphagnicola sy1 TaxID=1497020 RepID=A0A098TJQ6_9CYAN|nr:hypothetical protein DO97_07960 [Neosynechococcus sphagnicola sy1]